MAAMMPALAVAAPDFSGVWQLLGPASHLTTREGTVVPLNAAAASLREIRSLQFAQGDLSFDPSHIACKPPGEPRILFEPFPFEIVQTSRQLLFSYQGNRLY